MNQVHVVRLRQSRHSRLLLLAIVIEFVSKTPGRAAVFVDQRLMRRNAWMPSTGYTPNSAVGHARKSVRLHAIWWHNDDLPWVAWLQDIYHPVQLLSWHIIATAKVSAITLLAFSEKYGNSDFRMLPSERFPWKFVGAPEILKIDCNAILLTKGAQPAIVGRMKYR